MGCGTSSMDYPENPYEGQAAIDPAYLARMQQQQQAQAVAQYNAELPAGALAHNAAAGMMQQPPPQPAVQAQTMTQQHAGLPTAQPQMAVAQPLKAEPAPAPAGATLGEPGVEFVLAGDFCWEGAEPAPNWKIEVMADAAGIVFGGNRADSGYEMHYKGTIDHDNIDVHAVFENGMVIQYEASLSGGDMGVANGQFFGRAVVLAAAQAGPGSEMTAGSVATISGTLTRHVVRAIEFKLGGADGWYAWDGEPAQKGFAMEVVVDRLGQVFGSNRNAAAGSELKEYRGRFSDGTLDVDAVFESGQVINYVGQVMAGMTWNGRIQVKTAGTNAVAFKPVGTTGTMGGNIVMKRAEQPMTRPLGMPMREYLLRAISMSTYPHSF